MGKFPWAPHAVKIWVYYLFSWTQQGFPACFNMLVSELIELINLMNFPKIVQTAMVTPRAIWIAVSWKLISDTPRAEFSVTVCGFGGCWVEYVLKFPSMNWK